jgi:hypothetical protein
MNVRWAGWMLPVAAVCFWTSWVLMPGVGVTDAATILRLVGAQPEQVLASSVLQLLSAALLAAAIPGLALCFCALGGRWGQCSVVLLALGACGNATDAIYHQLAYEMVRPGVDQAAMLPVMQRMQSVDLLFLLPLIFAFLIGCVGLAVGSAQSGIVAKGNPLLYVLCLLTIVLGRVLGVPGRTIGLTGLGLLSLSLGWIGVAIGKSGHKVFRNLSQSEEVGPHAERLRGC